MEASVRVESSTARTETIGWVAAALQLLLTVPLAFILNVWQDDAYTLHTTTGSLGYAFREAIGFEQNAPLYFVLMTLWRHIDGSAFFARSFSVLCAAAAVALLPAVIARYLPELDKRWITLAVTFNPFLIWAALEIRVYALIILLSVLLLLIGYDAFARERLRFVPALAYALVGVIALYTQYYLLFLILAQGLIVLLYHRRALLAYFAALGAALVGFAPMLVIIPAQMKNFRADFAAPHSVVASLHVFVAIVLRYVIAPEGIPHPQILAGAVVLAAIVLAIALRRYIWHNAEPVLPILTVCALVLFAIAIYVAREHVLNRHVASLFVPSVLSAFALATLFREPVRSRAVIGWAGFTLAVSLLALVTTYAHLAKPGDWIRVNAYLHAHEQPGQPIIVFEAENALPLAYYYHGPNRIVAIPRAINFQVYDVTDFVVRNTAQLEEALPKSRSGIWLVTAGECKASNVSFGCDVLERYIASRYRSTQRAQFYQATVRLLLPKN